jgi:hypothetical protein
MLNFNRKEAHHQIHDKVPRMFKFCCYLPGDYIGVVQQHHKKLSARPGLRHETGGTIKVLLGATTDSDEQSKRSDAYNSLRVNPADTLSHPDGDENPNPFPGMQNTI